MRYTQPVPPPKPVWEPTPLAIVVVFVIPTAGVIAGLHGWAAGWWIAGVIVAAVMVVAGFVRNDCR